MCIRDRYYRTHYGWVGGLKETKYRILMQDKPELAMRVAVRGIHWNVWRIWRFCNFYGVAWAGVKIETEQGKDYRMRCERLIHPPGPVSYTHLDVYKRQVWGMELVKQPKALGIYLQVKRKTEVVASKYLARILIWVIQRHPG